MLNRPDGADFMWSDASGIAVQDPSAIMGGPATLAMRRDLLPRLASAGLTLFWTVDSTIELIGATASCCAPSPEIERHLGWTPRETEY